MKLFTGEDFKKELHGKYIDWNIAYEQMAAVANNKLDAEAIKIYQFNTSTNLWSYGEHDAVGNKADYKAFLISRSKNETD